MIPDTLIRIAGSPGPPYVADFSTVKPCRVICRSMVCILTFSRIQSRVVTDLLMGHNTLKRHLYLLGPLDSPLCRKYGVREETSAYILCECEALASLRHAYLGSFFLRPENIRSLCLGAVWNYSKVTGLPLFDMGHKGPVQIKA